MARQAGKIFKHEEWEGDEGSRSFLRFDVPPCRTHGPLVHTLSRKNDGEIKKSKPGQT
jgi:hypothetical protein